MGVERRWEEREDGRRERRWEEREDGRREKTGGERRWEERELVLVIRQYQES